MELLAGESLATLIQQGPLAPSNAVSIACQLARALAAAHDRSVIHADVSPANIIVTNGHLTLIDFGLAYLRSEAADGPSEEVSGTPCYLAPERVRGFAPNEASDQYACGIVLYEMLTGWPPFFGTAYDVCTAHLHTVAPRVVSPFGPLPDRLCDVVARCLAKDPRDRFSSMQALLDEVNAIEEMLS
jgi:serine/threonine-protein kinase